MMTRVLIAIAAPVFFFFAVVLTLVAHFSPSEAPERMRAISPAVYGATDVQAAVSNSARRSPDALAALNGNADCLEALDRAEPEKLNRCGQVVIQVLADISAYETSTSIKLALDNEREKLVQRLHLAAVEVCRLQWARETNGFDFRTPACESSKVSLATESRQP